MRAAGPYTIHAAGVVCFPSFHVIWAILCGRALWNFRVARIPLTVLCGMIVASTLTTGWHYLTDVVAGVVIAAFTLLLAEIVCRRLEESPQSVTRLTSQYSESSLQLQ
jgi:membrane-associated phospholipid phosphatase